MPISLRLATFNVENLDDKPVNYRCWQIESL